MAKAVAAVANKPVWVELATPDAKASREFYSKVFGWQVEVIEDPQYGGYGMARISGNDVAGIGPKMSPEQPTAWSLYLGTDDIEGLAEKVKSAGGKVIAEPFDVGDQGRMAVFQDPSGAFISAWQATQMRGFESDKPGAYGWAELNARGKEKALPFYEQVFGWTSRESPMGEGQPTYTEFKLGDESVAGGWEMNQMIPAEVPSYWQIYFNVDDVDAAFRKVLDLVGREMLPPQDFPGGRFAIVQDPQGAGFGLLKTTPR
jgi:predicted enzyme related to lactoylglutathione lyase